MSLVSTIGALLAAVTGKKDEDPHASDIGRSWREAIHASRNSATIAMVATDRATRSSSKTAEALNESMRRQEEALPPQQRDEIKAFLDRQRGFT